MNKPVKIVEISMPKIWIVKNIFGGASVMVQYHGLPEFEYCVFNYQYPYTDNAGVQSAAEEMARSLGAEGEIEIKFGGGMAPGFQGIEA